MVGTPLHAITLREGRALRLGERCLVMGILNCTPDSFSDGGAYETPDAAVERGLRMVAEGAAILDVGGESSRPGAATVNEDEQRRRVLPVIRGLRSQTDVPISIDTTKAAVAAAALDAGADLVNDIRALEADREMVSLVTSHGCPVVLMHMRGTPETMQDRPQYADVVDDVRSALLNAARRAEAAGVPPEHILLDPGFGFGKTFAHNAQLLNHMSAFVDTGYPILVGLSRKSMIQHALGLPVGERLEASLALAVLAAHAGAAIVRVHDVLETVRAVGMVNALQPGPGMEEAVSCPNG